MHSWRARYTFTTAASTPHTHTTHTTTMVMEPRVTLDMEIASSQVHLHVNVVMITVPPPGPRQPPMHHLMVHKAGTCAINELLLRSSHCPSNVHKFCFIPGQRKRATILLGPLNKRNLLLLLCSRVAMTWLILYHVM